MRTRTLKIAAITVASGLLLAACSNTSTPGAAASAEPADGASGETFSFEHARGTAVLPTDPQRIVTLEPLELDVVVALGLTPAGTAVAGNVTSVPEYLGIDDVPTVGTVPEPDLEAIAEIAPDIILGTESRHSQLFDQLNQIAPTVFIGDHSDPWRDNALVIGGALNREEETQALLDAVDARCEQIKTTYGVEGQTAQLIRPRDESTLSIYGPVSFAGSLLECVGFTIPDREWVDGLQADVSPENVASAAADNVFLTTTDVDDQSTIPAAISANGEVFPQVNLVDTSYWVSGVGPKGAQMVLDDIEQYLQSQQQN